MIDGRRSREAAAQRAPEDGSRRSRIRLGERLVALGVSADAVTLAGVLLAAGTAVAVAFGQFLFAVAGIIVGGLMDALDGAVAKAASSCSPRGAFLDSVADRLADSLILGGLAWYLASGADPRLALLPLAILGVSNLISYERAKAESLGFDGRGGLMERAERLILLAAALFFSTFFSAVLAPILWALLVLSSATALGRFVRIWRQASGEPAVVPSRVWGRGRVESRWRAFRETGGRRGRDLRPATRRARREEGPLSTRLRRVLGSETALAGSPRRHRLGTARSARALRRRLDGDR